MCYPQASDPVSVHFLIRDRTLKISVAKHPKAQKGIDYPLGKEDSSNSGRHVRKRIAYATYDKILEEGGISDEWRSLPLLCEISLCDKLIG